ncbi:MAG: YbdK family carboxylate-amine ligase, partial [Actinomycetota bacterium]|nr:YbdK family carboxylate-amine ligase [Actinomycetota bacterium]
QWWGRQMLIYGVHVHVGIESRDKVLPIWRAMLTMFGHIQSLSASSPYWAGHDTGYASNRALMFQQLPTAGLGWQFEEWSQLERYVEDMTHTGVISEFNEVRWDVRPSPGLGTLEMRIADGAANLLEVRAISAFTHCLVEHFSSMIDAGEATPTLPAWFVQENKWRSARYGMDAILILDRERDERLVTESVEEWLDVLAPVAERLGCAEDLEHVRVILRRGASYQRQRAAARRAGGELGAVVDSLVAEMRAGKPL